MGIIAADAAPFDEAVERARFAVAGARNIGEAVFDQVAHPADFFAAFQLAEAPVDEGMKFVRRTVARFVEIGDRAGRKAVERHRGERAEIDRGPVDLDPRATPGAQHGLAAQPYRLADAARRSEEHTSELQSLMRISYAVFCLKKKKTNITSQLKHHS